MKKFFLIVPVLMICMGIHAADSSKGDEERLAYFGEPMEYTEVEVINRAPMPITIRWMEYDPKSGNEDIEHVIEPNNSKVLQLGKRGKFYTPKGRSSTYIPYVSYSPLLNDPEYTEKFQMELYQPGPIVFTANTLADILSKIYRLNVEYTHVDTRGNTQRKLRHIGTSHPSSWQKTVMQLGKEQEVDDEIL